MILKIKKLHPDAHLPQKAYIHDAAYDLAIPEDVYVRWDEKRVKIPLGLAMELPTGFCAIITHRSDFSSIGLESKTEGGMKMFANADVQDGLIDPDYRGEICAIIHNREPLNYIIPAGTRICQMLIHQLPNVVLVETESLSESDHQTNSLGSSGAMKK